MWLERLCFLMENFYRRRKACSTTSIYSRVALAWGSKPCATASLPCNVPKHRACHFSSSESIGQAISASASRPRIFTFPRQEALVRCGVYTKRLLSQAASFRNWLACQMGVCIYGLRAPSAAQARVGVHRARPSL
ncbi:transcriptional regulator, XRE family domain protein [Thauera sp. SWB20]|nr:transcriptional regulator, XRE family domain protein [Thauera sp. SWB20]